MTKVRRSFVTIAVLPALVAYAANPAQSSAPFESTASNPAPATRKGNNSSAGPALPDSSNGVALLIRTDSGDGALWRAIVTEASRNQPTIGFSVDPANVYYNVGLHPVDDGRFEGTTMQELLEVAPNPTRLTNEQLTHPRGEPDTTPLHAYIVDAMTMTNPDHPRLAVNYYLDRGQHFRLTPKAIAAAEINFSISNLDFNDFIGAAGPDGIVRDY